jgi:hypothetical protein
MNQEPSSGPSEQRGFEPPAVNANNRLLDLLDDSIFEKYPAWKLERGYFEQDGHRLMSPPEPCNQCGKTVFLLLAKGRSTPVWLMWGQLKHTDTLFPQCSTKRHTCGAGESWSVEAALFVEAAMREWAMACG